MPRQRRTPSEILQKSLKTIQDIELEHSINELNIKID